MNTELVNQIAARWNDPSSRPLFKGELISDDGCMCAQGDILHTYCGYSAEALRKIDQIKADREVAKALGISIAHSILLRKVNDSMDGAPSIVLTNPEKIIGPEAPRVLKFWRHLDAMSKEERAWTRAATAAWAAAAAAAAAAWTTWVMTEADDTTWTEARATNEIQGHTRLDKLCFLPLFGIESIAALDAMEAP